MGSLEISKSMSLSRSPSTEKTLQRVLSAGGAIQRNGSFKKLKPAPSLKNFYRGWGSRHQRNARLTLMCGLLTILILRGSISPQNSEFEYFNQNAALPQVQSGESQSFLSSSLKLGPRIGDWDQQRAEWNENNPGMNTTRDGRPRMLLVTGSQDNACKGPQGDHFLLKAIKNKIDYCRIHDIDIFYNMANFQEELDGLWFKPPTIRKVMLAHPEAEWIWWMDSDALFTDMTFELPMDKYVNHNMVIHGFPWKVFDDKDWCGLNAGVFLVRNNQWTLDFLDIWAPMGDKRGRNREMVGKVFSQSLTGRPDNYASDDQSALVYLLNTLKEVLLPNIFLEHSFYLHGFWVILSDKYEEFMKEFRPGFGDHRWPFVTHFVGCKYCSGTDGDYDRERCNTQMERAFNFADNQVLQIFGFQHDSLADSNPKLTRVREDTVEPLKLLTENLWTNATILF